MQKASDPVAAESAPEERDGDGGKVSASAGAARWSKRRLQRQQSVALTILATLAVLFSLAAAQAILLPITMGLLLALTLRPVVRYLEEKQRIPPLLTCITLLLLGVITLASAGARLVGPAQEWLERAPERMQVVGEKLSGVRERLRELANVSERIERMATGTVAASEAVETADSGSFLERLQKTWSLTPEARAAPPQRSAPVAVEIQQPRLFANLSILTSAGNFIGMIAIALVMGFFLLWEGDLLLNNVITTLPRFADKKNAVRLVQNVERGISRYLLTVTLINSALGIVVGIALWALGLPNPALWGIMIAVLNFIPYLGPMIGLAVIFLVSVFSFDSLAYAVVPPLVCFVISAIEGNFITPALVGRSISLNSVAVISALVLWGWLWGIGGAIIGVPLLIIFKLICDQFERTAGIGALLGAKRGIG